MKTCANCGIQNPDDAMSCQACSTTTFISSSPEAVGGHIISPEEQRFWQRMTFRQFGVFFIRMQAIWLFFNAILDVTFLVPYLNRLSDILSGSPGPDYGTLRNSFFLEVCRLLLNVAGGIACIQFADQIVSWLIKDMLPKRTATSPDDKPTV